MLELFHNSEKKKTIISSKRPIVIILGEVLTAGKFKVNNFMRTFTTDNLLQTIAPRPIWQSS